MQLLVITDRNGAYCFRLPPEVTYSGGRGAGCVRDRHRDDSAALVVRSLDQVSAPPWR